MKSLFVRIIYHVRFTIILFYHHHHHHSQHDKSFIMQVVCPLSVVRDPLKDQFSRDYFTVCFSVRGSAGLSVLG